MTQARTRGMTVIELTIVVVVVVAIAIFLLPLLTPRARGEGRSMKDAVQIRGVQQAMAIWANSNKGLYPLPSLIDAGDATVAAKGTEKDTTANILSVLIYTGGVSVELLYSPAEANTGGIQQDDDYMFDLPKTAIDPAKALWDPAFATDFTGGKVGNTSYAHVLPGGGRGALWRDTSSTTQAVVGNRGPEIGSLTGGPGGKAVPKPIDGGSNTFLIHGSRTSWEGWIAYNDCHANFETSMSPKDISYTDRAGKKLADCLFYDEPDDAAGTNVWMSIWTKAGAEKKDFVGIWD